MIFRPNILRYYTGFFVDCEELKLYELKKVILTQTHTLKLGKKVRSEMSQKLRSRH